MYESIKIIFILTASLKFYLRVIARMVRTPVITRINSITTSKCQPASIDIAAIGNPILSNFGQVSMPFGVSSKYGEPGI